MSIQWFLPRLVGSSLDVDPNQVVTDSSFALDCLVDRARGKIWAEVRSLEGGMAFWGIELLSIDEFQYECRRKYHQRCSTYTFILSRLFKRLQSINIASLRNSPLTVCPVPDARRRTPRNSLLCALRPALYTLQISLFSTWSIRLCSRNWDVKTKSLSRLTGNDWFSRRPPEKVTFTS